MLNNVATIILTIALFKTALQLSLQKQTPHLKGISAVNAPVHTSIKAYQSLKTLQFQNYKLFKYSEGWRLDQKTEADS